MNKGLHKILTGMLVAMLLLTSSFVVDTSAADEKVIKDWQWNETENTLIPLYEEGEWVLNLPIEKEGSLNKEEVEEQLPESITVVDFGILDETNPGGELHLRII